MTISLGLDKQIVIIYFIHIVVTSTVSESKDNLKLPNISVCVLRLFSCFRETEIMI